MSKLDDQFERELSAAMRRVDAPDRLMVSLMNIADAEAPKPAPKHEGLTRRFAWNLPMPRAWMGGALAALMVLGVAVGGRVHEQHEKRAEAQHQFDEAQQITERALAHARAQVQRHGISLEDE